MTKKERFEKIAVKRTNNIINGLRLLSNCSNKNNYDYSEEDVKKIFNALDENFKLARSAFYTKLKKNKSFSL
jgi:hypothetical protein